jgi:hypothetical protein
MLAVAVLVAVLKVGLIIRDPLQALALQMPAFVMAGVLLVGGIFTPWLARARGIRTAVGGVVVTMVLFCGTLTYAVGDIYKPGTKELAQFVRAQVQPGDRVMHYHEFFHDFTFYAGRTVETVAYKGELELEEDAAVRATGRINMDEAVFRRAWQENHRVFAVARKPDVKQLFADPAIHYHLLAESRDHYLFSNQP